MIEYKHKINGLAQQGGLPSQNPFIASVMTLKHPRHIPVQYRKPNAGDSAAIWTLSGLVLAACGGGGGGGGGSSSPPVTFGFDAGAAAVQNLLETDDPGDFRLPIATQNAQGQVAYELGGDDADFFEIDDQGNITLKYPGSVLHDDSADQRSVTVTAIDDRGTPNDANDDQTITQALTFDDFGFDQPPQVLRHHAEYKSGEGAVFDVSIDIFTSQIGALRPVDPEGMTPENNTDYDFYWRVKTLPLGGTFTSTTDGTYTPAAVGFGFDTNLLSSLVVRYTHDGGNRVDGADDVHVLVLEVADKEFSTTPAVTNQYVVFIVREANRIVSYDNMGTADDSSDDMIIDFDTGIRFVLMHPGVPVNLKLQVDSSNTTATTNAANAIANNEIPNADFFEIKAISREGDNPECAGVPSDLTIYGIFVKANADLSKVDDDVTGREGINVDFEVTYDGLATAIDLGSVEVEIV